MKGPEPLAALLERADAVIYDFDNIVVDSEPFHYEAYNEVFSRHGHVLDPEEYWLEWTSKGGGAEGEIARHGLDLDPAEIRRHKDPIYSGFCTSGAIMPFPAALESIESLAAAGYMLAIASGSYTRDIEAILAAHHLRDRFAAVVGKDAITRIKPHPETYLHASGLIGVPPERCIAIEDAEKGIRSAKAARMGVILIRTEITRNLPIPGADITFDSMEHFAGALKSSLG